MALDATIGPGLRGTPQLTIVDPPDGIVAPGGRVVIAVRAADVPLRHVTLWVNGVATATIGGVAARGEVRLEQRVGDRAGLNTVGLRDAGGDVLGPDIEFWVRPDPVGLEDWEYVTEERLPAPKGRVILTIEGPIERTSAPGKALWESEMLAAVGTRRLVTRFRVK